MPRNSSASSTSVTWPLGTKGFSEGRYDLEQYDFACGGAAGTYGEANVKDGTAHVLFIQFRGDWQAIEDLCAKWKSR